MLNANQQFEFLTECFRTANARLLFRVKHRDLWLKFQLIAQFTLILLVMLGKIAYPDQTSLLQYLLILAFPIAALSCTLYVAQDRLIGHIIEYLNSVARTVADYGDQTVPIYNLESSPAGKDYTKTALPIRLIGQLFSFLMIPLWMLAYRLFNLHSFELIHMIMTGVDLILAGLIVWLLSTTYSSRRK